MDYEQSVPERYRVTYSNGVFRILDTWHPSIKNINDFNVEIPDTSPAMMLISTEQISALMTKLDEMGWLSKYSKDKVSQPKQTVVNNMAEDIRNNAINKITEVVTTESIDNTLAKEAISAIKSITEGK